MRPMYILKSVGDRNGATEMSVQRLSIWNQLKMVMAAIDSLFASAILTNITEQQNGQEIKATGAACSH
jgi:hypothetical protein